MPARPEDTAVKARARVARASMGRASAAGSAVGAFFIAASPSSGGGESLEEGFARWRRAIGVGLCVCVCVCGTGEKRTV